MHTHTNSQENRGISNSQSHISNHLQEVWWSGSDQGTLTAQKPFDVPEWHKLAKFTEPSQVISTVNSFALASLPSGEKLVFVKLTLK